MELYSQKNIPIGNLDSNRPFNDSQSDKSKFG